MKEIYQIVCKGIYTNEIVVFNFRTKNEFNKTLITIQNSNYLTLITTNIAKKTL